MGLIRFLLALSVLVAHSDTPLLDIPFLPSNIAVEAFFIISGFYMSMVITEKYSKVNNGYRLFITNRLLRIYPIYWVTLFITFCYSITLIYFTKRTDTISLYIQYWHDLKPFTWLYMIFTNIAIIGQDLLLFLKPTTSGGLKFTSHFLEGNPQLFTFQFIPQAWSLSLELIFYFLSPFFVRLKTNSLTIIIASIFIIRIITWFFGLNYDPWLYRFFPFELMWFLSGIISYKIYKGLLTKKVNKKINYCVFIIIIGLTLLTNSFGNLHVAGLIYLLTIVASIPFIFLLTKDFKFDRWIGEFSFPFYISHILLLSFVRVLISKLGLPNQMLSIITFLLTFIFSYFLVEIIGKRIEDIRKRRINKGLSASIGKTLP